VLAFAGYTLQDCYAAGCNGASSAVLLAIQVLLALDAAWSC
jgi:hypothetical protein